MAGKLLALQLHLPAGVPTDVKCEATSPAYATAQPLRASVWFPTGLRCSCNLRLPTVESFKRRQVEPEARGVRNGWQRQRSSGGFRPKVASFQEDGLLTEEREQERPSSETDAINHSNSYIGYGAVIQVESVYRERFVVRFSEVGANGTMSLEILSSLLQVGSPPHCPPVVTT